MKVRILTPTGSPTTAQLDAPPRRGDHVRLMRELFEVKRVTWPITKYLDGDSLCRAVEIHCDRVDDVGDEESATHPSTTERI